MRFITSTLVVCLLALGGCQQGPPPEPEAVPPAEDLSQWTLPELVQPEPPRDVQSLPSSHRPASVAEKVYDFTPGGVYKVDVSIEAPLDIILEPGEKVRNLLGRDPKPLTVAPEQAQGGQHSPPARWEYKEGGDGVGDEDTPHIFLLVREANATLGLTVTTTRRIYYLDCRSVTKSPIRAVRWKYPAALVAGRPQAKAPGILPAPEDPKRYHVGYQWQTSQPVPVWTPRHVVDDGKKLYLIYPEVVLFGTVPLVRAVGPNGPMVINTRQFLNVVILDALVPKVELGVGLGEKAERVTITRGVLRTIACPGDADCPVWPAAAQQLGGR